MKCITVLTIAFWIFCSLGLRGTVYASWTPLQGIKSLRILVEDIYGNKGKVLITKEEIKQEVFVFLRNKVPGIKIKITDDGSLSNPLLNIGPNIDSDGSTVDSGESC